MMKMMMRNLMRMRRSSGRRLETFSRSKHSEDGELLLFSRNTLGDLLRELKLRERLGLLRLSLRKLRIEHPLRVVSRVPRSRFSMRTTNRMRLSLKLTMSTNLRPPSSVTRPFSPRNCSRRS